VHCILATTIASLCRSDLIRLGALLYTLLYFNPLDHDLLRGVAEEVKYHVSASEEMEIRERLDKKFEYNIQRYSVCSCMCVLVGVGVHGAQQKKTIQLLYGCCKKKKSKETAKIYKKKVLHFHGLAFVIKIISTQNRNSFSKFR